MQPGEGEMWDPGGEPVSDYGMIVSGDLQRVINIAHIGAGTTDVIDDEGMHENENMTFPCTDVA